jgi:predicted lipoprotein with Yx(FWY)xxD motif
MPVRLVMTIAAVAALAAGCASSSSKGGSGGASSPPAGGSKSVTITIQRDRLTAADGKTLYYNTVDTAKSIKCTATCASEWPPVTGTPKVGSGLDDGDFATVARPDGTMQITYYGHPLYEFSGDAAGQAGGNGMSDEGGRWVVATPEQAEGGSSTPSSDDSSGGTGGY